MSELASAFRMQALGCANFGSPFHEALLNRAAEDIEAGGPTLALMAPWANATRKEVFADASHLRLLGGLHNLVLSGDDAAMVAAYPREGRPTDMEAVWAAVRAAMVTHADRLAAFITHEPQTNEVRRSAVLLPGFLQIAKETGLPLATFEIAASAGLNLNWDRYAYRLGDKSWGDPASPVSMESVWEGPAPALDAQIRVVSRAACDRRPSDLTDTDQSLRLLSYIWPDQFERMARIRAAMDLAVSLGVKVEETDAVDWTARMAAPRPGVATVAYHSVFWQYMPANSQAALAKVLETHGQAATAEAPFAWLRMEPAADNMARMELRLHLWPGGEERVLAEVHPHGAWVKWAL
ncbi:MAG: hypothetical protein CFE28_14505 [Alphaproteobacteria bacterium PA2]|nr:MAG: hypothetical protein CFE28_14505 [Alphaproteobacteria bacterium PA2]